MKLYKKIAVFFAILTILAMIVPAALAESPIVKKVTGGGWIQCPNTDKKTFGFNAMQLVDGTLKGSVEFIDHNSYAALSPLGSVNMINVHGYEITALSISSDGTTAWIWGLCRVNGDNKPYIFEVTAVDNGEPGKYDIFGIALYVAYPGVPFYQTSNQLGFPGDAGGGGNIKIHVPAP